MVPNGWEEKSLTEAGMTVTDGDRGKEYPNSSELYEEGYCLFLSAKNVTKKGFLFEETQFISKDKHEKLRKGTVKRGDIILTTRGTVGQTALYDESIKYDVIRINSGMATIGCNKSEVLSTFFYAYTNSSLFKRQIESFTFGSAQPQLTLKIIKSLKVPIPPLPEQQKIAQILTTWDKAIDTTARLIDNSKQQKKALMQQLLTGKKRLLDEDGRRFEDEWKSQLFKKTLKLDRGSSPRPIVNYTTESEDGVNWIKIGDTKGDGLYINSTKEKITPEGAKKSRKVSKGEIILSNSMSYGKPYILNIDGYIHDGWFVIRDYEKHLDKSYLIQILSSELIQMQYKRLAAGGVVSNISSELVYSVKIDIPSIPEQQKIATVLTNADKEIELLEQQLADLQQEKKALMQVLLTGKKRVVVDIDG